jgi:predicted PurR-regulated permease PerM
MKNNVPYKSSLSFLYQKFKSIDKRARRNLVIGASLVVIVVFTGFLLALISLIQFGGNLIDEALGELKVEKTLLHLDKTIEKLEK